MEDEIKKEITKEGGKNTIAVLSYIGILFLIPLLTSKDDPFVKFHVKQGLVLFIAEMATALVAWIPIIGWLLGFACMVLWLILSIMGIVNVVNKKETPLPLIGKFTGKFNL